MNQQVFIDEIVSRLAKVVGKNTAGLHEPEFAGNEKNYIGECIDTGFVSSVGPFVARFEQAISNLTKAKFAIAVVNATSGLHLSLLAAGINPGDEVLTPSLTFAATSNAIRYCGASPHFVDVDKESLGIDCEKLTKYLKEITTIRAGQCFNRKTGARIVSILPVHTFGHAADMRGLLKIAKEFRLKIIEDAAESIGSYYFGVHTGTLGDLGVISFNGNKTITTGGGGVVLTNSEELANRVRHLATTAKVPHRWEFIHTEVGYNYRMPNLNAALGLAQIEQLPMKIDKKRKLYLKYFNAFETLEGVKIFKEAPNRKSNYWLQALLLDEKFAHLREKIITKSNRAGISTRPIWKLNHTLDHFLRFPKGDLTNSIHLSKSIINLPSSPQLMTDW